MTKAERRDDIGNRHSLVMAERNAFTQRGSDDYKKLSELLKAISSEYENGNKERHIMHFFGGKYGYTTEAIS
ncbi:MAG: hypothetical protein LBM69_07185 [Lachnospiraceae bacterium]|nr:hypothetical protein [Lachnospiraceae bacterium]